MASVLVASGLAFVAPSAALAAPSGPVAQAKITVTPSKGLKSGDDVQVSVTGFPGAAAAAAQCGDAPDGTQLCNWDGAAEVTLKPDGSGTTSITVLGTIEERGKTLDCAESGSCFIMAFDEAETWAFAPIIFAPAG